MTPDANDADRTVFATVGTDHHRFDRLVQWTDRWVSENADRGVTGLVQTGTSATPRYAENATYLGHAEMESAVAGAVAVITHGGPGSIMLCSYLGKKPIVVPRRSDLGEHVDDHQILFSRRLAVEGRVDLAETEERLRELLDRALEHGGSAVSPDDVRHIADTVQRFERLVDEMLATPSRRPAGDHRFLRRAAPATDRGHGIRIRRGG